MSEDIFVPCLVALLIGIVAGMRAMTAPASIGCAARLGTLNLSGTWLAFLGYAWAPWILTLLAADGFRLTLAAYRGVPRSG